MKIYLALLKTDVKIKDVRRKLQQQEIEILDFYPKLKMLKFKSLKPIKAKELKGIFETLEEEKTDFSDQ